jgi:hypothetical protein
MGMGVGKLGMVLRNWGSRPENKAADGSRWFGVKNFSGQGACFGAVAFNKTSYCSTVPDEARKRLF